jgi:hypothetical protein
MTILDLLIVESFCASHNQFLKEVGIASPQENVENLARALHEFMS